MMGLKEIPSMFEPVHGSAPDISGKGIANPLAALWSISQMMDFFGEENWGTIILDTIKEILNKTDHLTPDLGGKASTSEVGDLFVDLLKENAKKKNINNFWR